MIASRVIVALLVAAGLGALAWFFFASRPRRTLPLGGGLPSLPRRPDPMKRIRELTGGIAEDLQQHVAHLAELRSELEAIPVQNGPLLRGALLEMVDAYDQLGQRMASAEMQTRQAAEAVAAGPGSHAAEKTDLESPPAKTAAMKHFDVFRPMATELVGRSGFCREVRRRLHLFHSDDVQFSIVLVQMANHENVTARHGNPMAEAVMSDLAPALEATLGELRMARYSAAAFAVLLPGARQRDAARLLREVHNTVGDRLRTCPAALDLQFRISATRVKWRDDLISLLERAEEANAAGMLVQRG